jgi:ferritin
MINNKMQDVLNEQINAELYSGYLYLSMSAYYQSINLSGFANWMYVQMLEEQAHAQILYNHIVDRGGRVILKAIEAPQIEWENALAPFEAALKHEQKITSLIHNLVTIAADEKDYASNAMLQWFVTEQVEEEKNVSDIIDKMNLVNSAPGGIFMIDRELAARVYTPPSILAGQQGGDPAV